MGDQKGGDQKGGDQKGGDQKGEGPMVWGAKVVGDQKGGDQKCACLKFIIIVSHICSCRSHVSNSDAIKLRELPDIVLWILFRTCLWILFSTLDIILSPRLDIIHSFGYYSVMPLDIVQ